MTILITSDSLRRAAHAPTLPAAEDHLGDLAPWVLQGLPAPAVPVDAGALLVLCVLQGDPGGRLQPGLALPLRWVAGGADDDGLPDGLLSVAELARSQVRPDAPWGLQRHPAIARCDLSRLPCDADSAWAAVVAGLLLAVGDLRTRPDVALTGAWSAGGLAAVAGLTTKAAVAHHLGITTVYAPAGQIGEPGAGCRIAALPIGVQDWRTSLAPALVELAVPPRSASPLATRWAYADLLPGSAKSAYLITSQAAVDHGRQLDAGDAAVGTLVAIISSSAAVTTATALRARRVVLLHTARDQGLAEAASHVLGAELRCFDRRDDLALAQLVRSCQPEVLDLQGGTKRMALVAAQAAPESAVVVLDGDHDGTQHRCGGERLIWVRPRAQAPAVPLASAPSPARASPGELPPMTISHRTIAWSLQLAGGGSLPAWKGSMIRGILGHGLLAVARGAPQPPWPGLQPEATCLDALFEPQRAWASPRATHLWTLQVRDARESWSPGEILSGAFIIHGPWPDWTVGLLQEAFEVGVAQGLGHARIPAALTAWTPADLDTTLGPAPEICTIALQSPASLRDGRDDCDVLSGAIIAQSLLRRVNAISMQSLGHLWLDGDGYRAAAAACRDLLSTARSTTTSAARWSNRQQARVVMPTVSGEVTISGPTLPTCWPWLGLAPHLNVGRRTHLGMGVCSLATTAVAPQRNIA